MGYDSVRRLSQYMGDFIPDAQVKGLALSSFIALICKSDSAVISPVSSKLFLMLQRYIVFLNEKTVTIGNGFKTNPGPDDVLEKYTGKHSLTESYNSFLKAGQRLNLYIKTTDNFAEACNAFNAMFTQIKAGGGIVRNHKHEYLFIKRLGKWDLPKGKLHKNEAPMEGALREVMEETGLTTLSVTKSLPSTFHIYTDRKGKEILKETYWFEMVCPEDQQLVPQLEEDITEVRWFAPAEIDIPVQNTYASLQHLLEQYLQI